MPEEAKSDKPTKKEDKAPEPLVTMQHEVFRHAHRMAIGDAWFDVADDGTAQFPLSLIEAAELAGFRRVE